MRDFLRTLLDNSIDEINKLRLALILVICATVLGVFLIAVCRQSVGICIWIAVPFWFFTAFELFSVWRFIKMHVTGESLEFVEALFARFEAIATVATTPAIASSPNIAPTGLFSNPFIAKYWEIISGIFLAQTVVFLLLPLYINFTSGGLTAAIVIAMLLVVIAISSVKFFVSMFRAVVCITVVIYAVGLVFVLFPQVNRPVHKIAKIVGVPSSSDRLVGDLRALQEKQQEDMDNRFLQGVIAWQKKHPGAELPQEYKDALARGGEVVK